MPETKIEHVVNSMGFFLEFLTLSSIREAFGIFFVALPLVFGLFFLFHLTPEEVKTISFYYFVLQSQMHNLCFCVGCSGFFFRNVLLFGMPMLYIKYCCCIAYLFIDLYFWRKFLELYELIIEKIIEKYM
jgi:hypothetical protein